MNQNAPESISFSDEPGCRERHLRRKYKNPLFVMQTQPVTQTDVDDARHFDEYEHDEFIEDFNDLIQEVSDLDGKVETELILEIKERIDRIYDRCSSFGSDHTQYKNALVKLHHTIMGAIRKAAGDDSLALKELEREQQARELHLELMEYKLVSDLLRPDSPINDNELVPTLMSEDAESVQVVMSLFEPDQQTAIREEATNLMSRLASGFRIPEQVQASYQAIIGHKQ